jgi:hypothetical protein
MMRLGLGRSLLLAAAALLVGARAHAVVLTPGVATPLEGTTVADKPWLAGTVVEDEIIPFSFVGDDSGGLITGEVQQRVVLAIDNTYDFYWRVQLDDELPDALGSFRLGSFIAPEYDADYRTDGTGTVGPKDAYLFGSPYVGYVNFDFGPDGLQEGRSSYFMFLDTTATSYDKSALFDLTNVGQTHISTAFAAFTPTETAPVPEPSTLALVGLGLGALRRARRRTK